MQEEMKLSMGSDSNGEFIYGSKCRELSWLELVGRVI